MCSNCVSNISGFASCLNHSRGMTASSVINNCNWVGNCGRGTRGAAAAAAAAGRLVSPTDVSHTCAQLVCNSGLSPIGGGKTLHSPGWYWNHNKSRTNARWVDASPRLPSALPQPTNEPSFTLGTPPAHKRALVYLWHSPSPQTDRTDRKRIEPIECIEFSKTFKNRW